VLDAAITPVLFCIIVGPLAFAAGLALFIRSI
jgi:hypothetical protein